jgi:hypothetical protein
MAARHRRRELRLDVEGSPSPSHRVPGSMLNRRRVRGEVTSGCWLHATPFCAGIVPEDAIGTTHVLQPAYVRALSGPTSLIVGEECRQSFNQSFVPIPEFDYWSRVDLVGRR